MRVTEEQWAELLRFGEAMPWRQGNILRLVADDWREMRGLLGRWTTGKAEDGWLTPLIEETRGFLAPAPGVKGQGQVVADD